MEGQKIPFFSRGIPLENFHLCSFSDFSKKAAPLLLYDILKATHTNSNTGKTYRKAIGELVLGYLGGCSRLNRKPGIALLNPAERLRFLERKRNG
jgi:hypothetical protein